MIDAFKDSFVNSLPSISDLPDFLLQPLPAAIHVPTSDLSTWTYYSQDADLMRKLFSPDGVAPCGHFRFHVMERLLTSLEHALTTDASAIWLWDSLICNMIAFAIPSGCTMERHWSHARSELLRWPSFVLAWQGINVLRGKEVESNDDLEIDRQRLCKLTTWLFGDQVPYLLGCVVSPYKIDLYACPETAGEVISTWLCGFDISNWHGKFSLMLAALNMGRMLQHMKQLCRRRISEYTCNGGGMTT